MTDFHLFAAGAGGSTHRPGAAVHRGGSVLLFNVSASVHPPPPPEMETLMLIAGILELAGGLLSHVGFLTRPVAFVLSGMMAVPYWDFHAPMNPFPTNSQGAAAILLCFVFFDLVFARPGAWSVDSARRARIAAGAEEGTLPWPS